MATSYLLAIDSRLGRRVLWGMALILAALGALEFAKLVGFQPLGVDFLPLWTAGRMAAANPDQVYDFAAVSHAQAWLLPNLHWPRPYAYPPTALLVLAPFGALPFWPALALWVALGFGALLAAGARLAQGQRPLALILIALSPAVLLAAMVGQSVLLAAAALTLAMTELERRPRLAGALLALAVALKPQAALLAPVALIAGGAFGALASAVVIETLLIAASGICFGFHRWPEWFASLPAFQTIIETSPGLAAGVITPTGAAMLLGLSGAPATFWRVGFALIGVVLVWRAFRRPGDTAARLAALAAGSLLAAPYAMHYDGTLLAPAAVVMAVDGLGRRGWIWWLLGLCAVCEVTAPHVGPVMVLAFALLASLGAGARPLDASTSAATASAPKPAGRPET